MKVRALRGVCVGVDRHLSAGDSADLDPAMVTFLVGIGAVEPIDDKPAVELQPPPDEKPAPGEPGKIDDKPAVELQPPPDEKPAPGKPGKKEK